MRIGGVMLVGLGLLLVSGAWTSLIASMQGWISGFELLV
jgi:cytochrome c-type biogenesis protein